MAIVLSLLFYDMNYETAGVQNRFGVLFVMLLFLSMMTLGSLPIWRDSTLLFRRERGSMVYGTAAYYLSIIMFDILPNRILPPVMFSLSTYWLTGLYPHFGSRVVRFTNVLVLANVVSALLSMGIGAASPNNALANLLGSIVIMGALLFGGFMLNKNAVPGFARPLEAMSAFSYAYEVGGSVCLVGTMWCDKGYRMNS